MNSSLLKVRNLCLPGSDGKAKLLNDHSLDVTTTDRIAVSGPSGCGKSLLLRSICLLEPRAEGEILWKGSPVANEGIPAYRARVLYLPQKPIFFPGSVEENLRAPLRLKVHQGTNWDAERITGWLNALGKEMDFLKKDARKLSGGESQLSALIRGLLLQPELLCLDEPTSALDAATVLRMETLMKREFHGAWLWISHDRAQMSRVGEKIYSLPDKTFLRL